MENRPKDGPLVAVILVVVVAAAATAVVLHPEHGTLYAPPIRPRLMALYKCALID